MFNEFEIILWPNLNTYVLSSPEFLHVSSLSYAFTSSFHNFTLTSMVFYWFLAREEFILSFFIWLQRNLMQFWVIRFLTCFTNQPIPNLVSMSWMNSFWRCMGIFENGRYECSLKCWRHDSFNLCLNTFLTYIIMIFLETTSYSTLVLYVSTC